MKVDTKNNETVSVIVNHSLTRNEYLDYLYSVTSNIDEYRSYAGHIVTPHDVNLKTYSNSSLHLQRCIKSCYEHIDAKITIVLNEYEYVFRPLHINREFTIILTFDDNNKFNKFKIQHPKVFEKTRPYRINGVL